VTALQTKCFIELSDILSLKLGCKKCGAVCQLPFDDYRDMPYMCVNCEAQFAELNDKQVKPAMKELVRAIRSVKKLAEAGNFNFSLEITSQSHPS
jgi:hypothetical protein